MRFLCGVGCGARIHVRTVVLARCINGSMCSASSWNRAHNATAMHVDKLLQNAAWKFNFVVSQRADQAPVGGPRAQRCRETCGSRCAQHQNAIKPFIFQTQQVYDTVPVYLHALCALHRSGVFVFGQIVLLKVFGMYYCWSVAAGTHL